MKRITPIATAAFAALAMLAPGSALAGGAHLLGMYKYEKHIDIQGDGGEYTISCPNSDIAVDGMWRIDNADQDNDYSYDTAPSGNAGLDVLNSLEPAAAYPDDTSVSMWHFEFAALEGGDVQGKLFLTCLPKTATPNNGHTVAWLPSVRHTDGGTAIAAPSLAPDTYTNTGTLSTTACPAKQMAIQPGFQWTGPNGSGYYYGKPYMRTPTSGMSSTKWQQWDWGFFTPTGGTVTLYWRCLPYLSDYNQVALPHHRHAITVAPRTGTTPNPGTLKKGQVTEIQVICGEHYKAMLGAWNFGYSGYVWNGSDYYKHIWYLGMDPRPKTRAYKVMNTDLSNDVNGSTFFGALCWKDKTS
jgi:hypothetical protein